MINVTSNAGIGQDQGKPLYNSGTIVSTDGCIRHTTNYKKGTIIGGTFLNVTMTGGTIKNAIVKGEIRCDELDSEYVIENVTLEEGAEIKVIKQGGYEIVANEPGTYTVTVQNGEVTNLSKTDPAPETDNGSNNDSDAKPEKDTNEDKKQEEPQEPKESEEQIFTRELLTRAATAKAGDIVAIDATLWHSFNGNVLKELLSKEGVSYTFYYNYGGECFYITIPAGAVLEEGCEWYGPLKLNAMFGRTMIDKSELHAAINQ